MRRRPRQGQGGYTLVEVLVAARVATIGLAALLNLQVASLEGMSNARAVTMATNLSEHFIEMVRARTLACPVPDGSPNCQFRPAIDVATGPWTVWGNASDNRVGPVHLDFDQDGDYDFGIATEFDPNVQRQYCVHWRTGWVIPNVLLRVDVRVLWPRPDTDLTTFRTCTLDLVPDPTSGVPLTVGMVTMSTDIEVTGF